MKVSAIVLLGVVAFGCTPSPERLVVGGVEFEAPGGSGQPNLYATAEGRVILTWFEETSEGGHALRLAVRANGEWSEPRTVVEGEPFFVNWADFPSAVELPDGTLIVHWLEKVAEPPYAYHVKLVISRDGGATWSAPIVPHTDDSPTEHGFVSMVPWGSHAAALVWLDGRATNEAASHGGGEGLDVGEMQVRASTIDSDGGLGADALLDRRACECCQTALVSNRHGLVAAYRDRSESEVRDIAVVRFVDGSWTAPVQVASDDWEFPGCPVNGPQLSALGESLAVVWFTAPEQKPAVYVAFSRDAGASFEPPIRVDDGQPLGRVDVELLPDGSALLTWLERSEDGAEVRGRVVQADGALGSAWLVSETSESRASGFPRIARAGDEVLFAWTLTGDEGGGGGGGGVRVAALRIGG